MPTNHNEISHEPEYLDWSDRDEAWIARGYINGYGTFECHDNSPENVMARFKEFSVCIQKQMIEYGEIDLDNDAFWSLPIEPWDGTPEGVQMRLYGRVMR